MADSDLWRDLAVQFLRLADPYEDLSALWQEAIDPAALGKWIFEGPLILQAQFDALARRAAMNLPYQGTSDLLDAWLEALRLYGDGFEVFATNLTDETGAETETLYARTSKLCQVSANYCKRLESESIQAEFEEKRQDHPQKAVPTQPASGTVAAQINRLREECELTVDDLAERMKLDVRSIRRHLAGDTAPYDRHLWAYQRLFSKLLNRNVVINTMP